MFLDRIDIDAHGPLNRVELGPFSEHLNVICGPEGSGKTAITRFIRDSLVHREYPLGMMSSSSGRVVWADRDGLVHCRREKDGTATGRRTVQFDPRGDSVNQFDSLRSSWISGVASSTDASRANQSIQIPESIVDGVITDTAVTSVARVVSACIRSGLDDPRTLDSLSLAGENGNHDHHRHRSLRAQLAEIEAELARLQGSSGAYDSLIARRRELTALLARPRHHVAPPQDHSVGQRTVSSSGLRQRIERLRRRQEELRHSITAIDAEIRRHRSDSPRFVTDVQATDAATRRQLDDLDAQMIRWRRTLAEVHALRDAISRYVGHGTLGNGYSPTAVEDVAARRRRLDGLLHHFEKSELHSSYDPFAQPSRLTPKDIDARIDAATRQIDWLLDRYAHGDALVADWYRTGPSSSTYGSQATVAEALRSIRHDLTEIRQRNTRSQSLGTLSGNLQLAVNNEIEELYQCERWLSGSIDQLMHRRDSLQGRHAPRSSFSDGTAGSWSLESLQRKRARRVSDLDRVTLDLADCRSRIDAFPHDVTDARWYNESNRSDWIDRDAVLSEIKQIDAQLADGSRSQWLRARRSQLINELGIVGQRPVTQSPLSEEASRWLVRLSAGRLRNVSWPYASFKSASLAHSIHLDGQRTGVCLDGRDEADCPAADRALAVLAVRMAAGCLLAKTGRGVPLVLETHRELLQGTGVHSTAYESTYQDWDIHGRSNHPVVAAIGDYARGGRQVVLLTSCQATANQIHRDGGRIFRMFADRIVHAHRPIWRSQYAPEQYVGPHPHTYGNELAPDVRAGGDETLDRHYRERDFDLPNASRPSGTPLSYMPRPLDSVESANRNFDTAWREAYGLYDNPDRNSGLHETDWAPAGADLRDGYYASESYTTMRPTESVDRQSIANSTPAGNQVSVQRSSSPFYLSVDSPIDQAPSIDALAAARLRGLKITHINHLMQQDSNRLADALGLANVDAATIRRWQSECRLCCRVPQLRGFDARVLVGCGVTDPAQLASIPPTELLHRVESFLATGQGQRILRSGSSHELSRITTWIASARGATSSQSSAAFGPGRVVNGRVIQASDAAYAPDSDRDEYEADHRDEYERQSRTRQSNRGSTGRNRRSLGNGNGSRYGIVNGLVGSSNGAGQGYSNGSGRGGSGNSGARNGGAGNGGAGNGGAGNGGAGNGGAGNGVGYRNGLANSTGVGNGNGASNGHGSGNGSENGNGSSGNGSGRRSSSNGSRRSSRSSSGSRRSTRSRRGNGRSRRSSERAPREYIKTEREPREYLEREPREYLDREPREYADREYGDRERSNGERSSRSERSEREPREPRSESSDERELRFYLQRDSAVVDAPSIGARMAERLSEVGIETVDDLLNADPETLAAELDHKRVDAETIESWQHQATLVCRIPMLRGHDAQLLVAAEYTTPEEVAESDPEEMFSLIAPVSRSSAGKRIIRGGKQPDLAEIKDWIGFAQHTRDLMAA